ncbi:MAG: peptidase S8, partial [Candidatus Nitrosopelagicus sp.]
MDVRKIFFLVVFVSIGMILLLSQLQNQDNISIQVNDSGSYIGTDVPHSYGYDGTGIIISVIDTGVDFNHPDLLGFGPDGKVIGGYDFVDN